MERTPPGNVVKVKGYVDRIHYVASCKVAADMLRMQYGTVRHSTVGHVQSTVERYICTTEYMKRTLNIVKHFQFPSKSHFGQQAG